MKTIVAYANTSGGKLIIGVDDTTKEIVGVELSSARRVWTDIPNCLSLMSRSA